MVIVALLLFAATQFEGQRALAQASSEARAGEGAVGSTLGRVLLESADSAADADGVTIDMVADRAPVFYSLGDNVAVYADRSGQEETGTLAFHEPVSVLSFHGPWMHVRAGDGTSGFVRSDRVTNVWIRVAKSEKTVFVYRGERLDSQIPADLAYNFFTDKQRRGDARRPDHWRTPEGTFYVVAKNPNSQYHRAWVLNYPTLEDADRGLDEGIISASDHRRIADAAAAFRPPPMDTALGGFIEIHGRGTGARTSWTRGCVAIPDEEIDRLWGHVRVGTAVVVES